MQSPPLICTCHMIVQKLINIRPSQVKCSAFPRQICFLAECFQQDRAAVMLMMVMTYYGHDQLLLTWDSAHYPRSERDAKYSHTCCRTRQSLKHNIKPPQNELRSVVALGTAIVFGNFTRLSHHVWLLSDSTKACASIPRYWPHSSKWRHKCWFNNCNTWSSIQVQQRILLYNLSHCASGMQPTPDPDNPV